MEKCFPLELTNKIANKYPKCWNQVKLFRESKEKGDLSWDNLCYIPVGACIAITTDCNHASSFSALRDAQILAVTAPWRIYKQVYSFPIEMETLLFEQADDIAIPAEYSETCHIHVFTWKHIPLQISTDSFFTLSLM